MKYIVRKVIWDFEKEEAWLNEMARKGMALTDYSWGRYVFAEAPIDEYIYRIEMLENLPTHAESIAYLRFLEENGVEHVASYNRWIYLRKKTLEGPFDLYSDIDSRIAHYNRIGRIWDTVMWVEWIMGVMNLIIGIINLNFNERLGNFSYANVIVGAALTALGLVFFLLGRPTRKNLKRLRQEKLIRE